MQGLFDGAGENLLKAASEAARDFIEDAINEISCVRKEAEVKRKLPSLNNMRVVSSKYFF